MKKIIFTVALLSLLHCSPDNSEEKGIEYCYYEGHLLYTQQFGVCYYLNTNGERIYLDQSHCVGCLE
jgi:hypothetical protein